MTDVAGSIGAGTLIVFQPATPSGGLEVALGIQRLWQKTLKHGGRPAACLIAHTRLEAIEGPAPEGLPIAVGDKGVASIRDWADPATNAAIVVTRGGRWGLVASLAAASTHSALHTELFEASAAGGVSSIARWSFDGPVSLLPEHASTVLSDTARRLGVRSAPASYVDALDLDDPGLAMLALEVMGIVSMAEDDCRLHVDVALERLGLLASAAPRSRVVEALVPELLGHLARLGAHDLQLAAWMRGVKKQIGPLPPAWQGLVGTLSRERA